MKNLIILSIILSATISCTNNTQKNQQSTPAPKMDLSSVKVVNELDPICNMKTANHLSDTAQYKNNTYGFCSSSCKSEFKKNPEKYVQK